MVRILKAMRIKTVNIALMAVIQRIDIRKMVKNMSQEQFESEKNYRVALYIAKSMLLKGLINEREYCQIDTILIAKYQPIIGNLCI